MRSSVLVLALSAIMGTTIACKSDDGGTANNGNGGSEAGGAGRSTSGGSGGGSLCGGQVCVAGQICCGPAECGRCIPAASGQSCPANCEGNGGNGSGGSGGGGSCVAQQGSCSHGEACCAGLTCCAGVPVPAGQEYCGAVCPISDRNLKTGISPVDPHGVLERLAKLPISTWSYRSEASTVQHMGPMAQDFHHAFGLGASDRTILQVDADGVALAAIQALQQRVERLAAENERLRQRVDDLEAQDRSHWR